MTADRYIVRLALAAIAFFVLLGAFAWQRSKYEHLVTRLAVAEDAAQKKAVERARIVSDTILVHLAANEKLVTKTIERVRVETLMVHPITHADTLRAVAQLPTLAIEHATLQRECKDLRNTCAAFRASALLERTEASKRIAGLERIAAAKQSRHWVGFPDLVAGVGQCATRDGLRPCGFIGFGGRIGW